jgi:hypothetical protein
MRGGTKYDEQAEDLINEDENTNANSYAVQLALAQ